MQTLTLNSRLMANVDIVCFFLNSILKEPQNLFGMDITPLQSRKQNLHWGTSSIAGKKYPILSKARQFQSSFSFQIELFCLS